MMLSSFICLVLALVSSSSAAGLFFGTISPPLVTPTGVAVDRFAINEPGNFYGLAYFGGDKGYAATKFYTIHEQGGVSQFDTITCTTQVVKDEYDASSPSGTTNIFALAFAAPDLGYGSNIFYYLRKDTAANNTVKFGTSTPGGVVGVTVDVHIADMVQDFDSLTFSAANVGHGANLFYYLRHNSTCYSTFGAIDPVNHVCFSKIFSRETKLIPFFFFISFQIRFDIMDLGVNFDALYFTELNTGFGANIFYYLRHNTSNISIFGTLDPINKNFTDRYVLGMPASLPLSLFFLKFAVL